MKCWIVMFRSLLLLCGLAFYGVAARAQVSNTSSPYSRYGVGDREAIGYSKSLAVGGVSLAVRDKNMMNAVNPAAFSSQDSMAFILDVALRGRYVVSQAGSGDSHTESAANVHHVGMQFPVGRYFGVGMGFQPFTQMGYDVTRYETDPTLLSQIGNIRYHHHGNGGVNEAFLGLAFKPFSGVSIGVKGRFLFGSLNYAQDMYVPNHPVYADVRFDDRVVLRGYGLTAGVQVTIPFSEQERLCLGAIVESTPTLNAEHRKEVSQIYLNNTFQVAYNYLSGTESLSYPLRYGGGVFYEGRNLSYGADVTLQDWSSFRYRNTAQKYGGAYSVNAGLQWIPNPTDLRYYLKRVQYRFGAYYSQLPMLVNGQSIRDVGVTVGFGFPYKYFTSIFHTAFRLGMRGSTSHGLVRELYGELVLGVSLNDVWFVKRKYQ